MSILMQSHPRKLSTGAALTLFFAFAVATFAQDSKSPAVAPDQSGDQANVERGTRRRGGDERVAIGHDAFLGRDEVAEAVVAIFGSATSEGRVKDAIVSVLGDTHAAGPVGDAAVAVLGSVYVNGRVGDAVVAVLGNVELGPQAEVMGDVVAVGGTITRHPDAIVRGDVNNVSFGSVNFGNMEWLRSWFTHAALMGRPLAIGPNLGWAWVVAFSFLALYILIAWLFRPAVEQCTVTLETRPGYSVLATVLTVLLIPVTLVLLCVTVVGVALVPLVLIGLFLAALFGKVVMLGWLGGRFTRFFGDGPMSHRAVAVLIGGLVVLGLYLVPILGILVFKLLAWLGMGVVVYTLILRMQREVRPVAVAPAMAMAGGAGLATGLAGEPVDAPPVMAASPPPVFSAVTLPRAGFWIRVLALAIDIIVVSLVVGSAYKLIPGVGRIHFGPGLLPMIALYGALLWKLRGTTIGGIVCGLKVIRLDGRPIDWATSIVRALGCFLSLVVAGLGFIWVAFDEERQSWHDKIAGTTVVRVPKGVSLV